MKFADLSLDDPLTPCTNNPTGSGSVCFAVDELSYSHPAPYSVGTVAAAKMILSCSDHTVQFIGLNVFRYPR